MQPFATWMACAWLMIVLASCVDVLGLQTSTTADGGSGGSLDAIAYQADGSTPERFDGGSGSLVDATAHQADGVAHEQLDGDVSIADGAEDAFRGEDAATRYAAPSDLRASTDRLAFVRLSWAAPDGAAPVGYAIERDGVEIGTATALSFDDEGASSGSLGAPTGLSATEGTLEGMVRLTWQAPAAQPGAPHRYVVRAVYGTGPNERSEPSAAATGRRAAQDAANTVYEFSRDDGVTWQGAGSATSYDDTTPALGTIATTMSASHRQARGMVLAATAAPTITPAVPSLYRVRALTQAGVGIASESARGFAGVGRIVSYQWQRSAGDSADNFEVLPGVVGATLVRRRPSAQCGQILSSDDERRGSRGNVRRRARRGIGRAERGSGSLAHVCN